MERIIRIIKIAEQDKQLKNTICDVPEIMHSGYVSKICSGLFKQYQIETFTPTLIFSIMFIHVELVSGHVMKF